MHPRFNRSDSSQNPFHNKYAHHVRQGCTDNRGILIDEPNGGKGRIIAMTEAEAVRLVTDIQEMQARYYLLLSRTQAVIAMDDDKESMELRNWCILEGCKMHATPGIVTEITLAR